MTTGSANLQDLQFKIDQLRKDKMIYALEACAFSLLAMVLLLFASITPYIIMTVLGSAIAVFAIGFTIFMGLGNLKRLQKVKELEKQL